MANYTLEDLVDRADDALKANDAYVQDRLAKFKERSNWRAQHKVPVVAFCGWGRAGKDLAAEWWCKVTGFRYHGSASSTVLPILATMIGEKPEVVWEERHKPEHREFWIKACHAVRAKDLTIIARMTLGIGDVWVGPRCGKELVEAGNTDLFNYSLWIQRDTVPKDPTVEFEAKDCDSVLLNDASKSGLLRRVERFHRLVLR